LEEEIFVVVDRATAIYDLSRLSKVRLGFQPTPKAAPETTARTREEKKDCSSGKLVEKKS
jgi:hypothetical protein